jgi:SEC-C motif domain protein
MRSRYSAFATNNEQYLLESWHPRTRPVSVDVNDGYAWTRLEILSKTGGSMLDVTGTVAFVAHYNLHGQTGTLQENSAFERLNGKWYYVDEA